MLRLLSSRAEASKKQGIDRPLLLLTRRDAFLFFKDGWVGAPTGGGSSEQAALPLQRQLLNINIKYNEPTLETLGCLEQKGKYGVVSLEC